MRKPLAGFLILMLGWISANAQTPSIRIADTLTQAEQSTRNPVLLRSEVDSLVRLYAPVSTPVKPEKEIVISGNHDFLNLAMAGLGLLLILVLIQLRWQHTRLGRVLTGAKSSGGNTEPKSRNSIPVTQKKIEVLQDELLKLGKENENLSKVISEYNGIQKDYDALKRGMLRTYKVKHYPGNDKSKDEQHSMQGVFDTENAVTTYAYEKFLKPILAIADRNKNNPARVSDEERQKVLDLLVSLSLLYIEYLYLRVNELSIGGKMVERIGGFSNGNGLDPLLMKQMNKASGNRALVLRMILDRSDLHKLTYPVFDETNLNN